VFALTIATAIAAAVALFATRVLIGVLTGRGASEPILQQNAANSVVPPHQHKAGTPTMGGLAIIGAALLGYLLSHVRAGVVFSDQTLIVVGGILAMATLGLVDDLGKIRARQNRGIYWKLKGALSLVVSFGIATVLVAATDIDTRLSLTLADLPGWELGPVLWVVWAGFIIFATANRSTSPTGSTVWPGARPSSGSSRSPASRSGLFGIRRSTATSSTPTTWRCWRPRSPEPAPDSSGGTRRPRASSWAMSAHWHSAPHWRCWRSRRTRISCSC
jgi:hypothetical protein